MNSGLSRTYNPSDHEQRLYEWWDQQGYFRPEQQVESGLAAPDAQTWCITMPPPNVTGALHLGHAMTAAVEDLMTRYYRMRGYRTLFLPGSDHAGIATQNVVERELGKQGLTRYDLGREAFIENVWEWKDVYHARITIQHKRLGISCDWARERFTLDEALSHAVRTTFVQLYQKGLIYRGTYLVNWCPRCTSAVSELEVEPDERTGRLWTIRYPVVNDAWEGPRAQWGSGQWAQGATEFIEMATTRPETILGDTAVATSSDDPRWSRLVGHRAVLPAIGRSIPIIADEMVDPEFGTGAVKVTPAHDPADNEVGLRHGLEAVNVMTDTCKMNDAAGPYAGQDRYECRRNIVADFETEGLLTAVKPYSHAVGTCQRCNTDIEPRISTQWFVTTKPLAEAAMQAVRDGRTRIIPDREERRFFHWMENMRDWCISRQLWWGHRIPVWYCDECDGRTVEVTDPSACSHCGSTSIHQDPDVLDTWFSSGLWPFSTLGWPNTSTPDFLRFYPTTVRETGYDILFFWVAREMMLGIEMTGQTPYETVYLHGLVRNEEGKKIGKSMENIEEYDPLKIIDRYGADALRYTLLTSATPGLDMNLDPRRLENARNFTNKVWQAARFVLMNLSDAEGATPAGLLEAGARGLTLPNRWILSRANRLAGEVARLFDSFQYGEAGRQIYDFLWGEYCDWYIEAAKVLLYGDAGGKSATQAVLLHVLDMALRLLHPFTPFFTEAIWQALPRPAGARDALMVSAWPEANPSLIDDGAEADMALMMDLIRGIRNRRAEYDVTPGKRIPAQIAAADRTALLRDQRDVLCALARLDSESLAIAPDLDPPGQAASVIAGEVIAYLPLAGMVDLDAERGRLEVELADIEERIARSRDLLDGPFADRAPAPVVQRERDKASALEGEAGTLRERLSALG